MNDASRPKTAHAQRPDRSNPLGGRLLLHGFRPELPAPSRLAAFDALPASTQATYWDDLAKHARAAWETV